MQLLVTGVDPGTRAVTRRALKVCNSYLYVLDQVLLPTPNNSLSAIPEVNATFLQALANLGNPSTSSSSTSGSVGNVTDPVSAASQISFTMCQPAPGACVSPFLLKHTFSSAQVAFPETFCRMSQTTTVLELQACHAG